jgi:hypothetical protein
MVVPRFLCSAIVHYVLHKWIRVAWRDVRRMLRAVLHDYRFNIRHLPEVLTTVCSSHLNHGSGHGFLLVTLPSPARMPKDNQINTLQL